MALCLNPASSVSQDLRGNICPFLLPIQSNVNTATITAIVSAISLAIYLLATMPETHHNVCAETGRECDQHSLGRGISFFKICANKGNIVKVTDYLNKKMNALSYSLPPKSNLSTLTRYLTLPTRLQAFVHCLACLRLLREGVCFR